MVRLDESKDYGTVSPPEHGAVAYQNGLYFDGEGKPVKKLCDPDDLKAANRKQKPAVATEPEPDDTMDMMAWALGEVKYPWDQVQEAIKGSLGVVVNNIDEAKALILGDKGPAAPDDTIVIGAPNKEKPPK